MTRIVCHILISILVLCSAIISRGALLLISNESAHFEQNTQQQQDIWTCVMFIINCMPYLIAFFVSLINVLFRQSKMSSFITILIVNIHKYSFTFIKTLNFILSYK